jgi:hypothetical protein
MLKTISAQKMDKCRVLSFDVERPNKEYGSPGFPTLLFLDKNGHITRRIVGSTSIKNIEKQFINSIK